jgi:putative transposase
MDEYKSLNHSQWECLYHVVFIPKCRRKTLYVGLRKYLGEVSRRFGTKR